MKKDIHPKSSMQEVTCSTCNHVHSLISTSSDITIDVCSNCHGFYTGNNNIVKATGRVERFNRMFGEKQKSKSKNE